MAAYAGCMLEDSMRTDFHTPVSSVNQRRKLKEHSKDVNTGNSNHLEPRRDHKLFTLTTDSFGE